MPFNIHERRSLITIASLYLIRMLGLFMVLPVLSIYGQNLEGATPSLLGLALGIYGLSQALLQIPFGLASDRFGRKKILILGFILFLLGAIICSQAENVYLLIFGRAIQGAGAVSAVLLALVADQISEKNRTISMAIIGASIGLSFGLSVVLAPIITEMFASLDGVFYIGIILGVLSLLIIVFCIDEQRSSGDSILERNITTKNYLSSVMTSNLIRLDLGIFILHFIQMCIWIAVPTVLINELGIALADHWVVYLITVGGGFMLMLPFMRYWDKKGSIKTSILVSIILIMIALLLLTKISHYWLFLIGLFVFFWGFNLLEATLPSTLTKQINPEAKGFASGIYSSCQFLGVFFGGVCGGLFLSEFGLASVFYLSAGLSVIWLLLMLPAKGLSVES